MIMRFLAGGVLGIVLIECACEKKNLGIGLRRARFLYFFFLLWVER
jgi:hypothetical protein